MKKFIVTILGIAATTTAIGLESLPAHAVNLSFTGNLATPNSVPFFSFTADGVSTVTIQSYSWGGGKNAAGITIAPGGFDLNLTLFNAAGNWYGERDDIGLNNLDFKFTEILPAGTYKAAIAAFGNNSAGFGNLSTPFNGAGTFQGRTSAYAFDILNVNNTSTAVPEPTSIIGTVLAGFAAIGLKRKLTSDRDRFR